METTRANVLLSGRVQGVFFRARAREEAHRLGLSGWVRNLPDGRVEAEFQGTPRAVEQAVAFCRTGPPHAEVDAVEVTERPVEDGEQGFAVR